MKIKNNLKKNMKIIAVQSAFLLMVLLLIYFLYPKVNVDVDESWVRFQSINAKVIMISNNPDFSNPRFLDFSERNNFSYNLEPGTYYWKSSNNLINGLQNKFTIESEVGLGIDREDENTSLINVGNVKINVTKNKDGVMVGHIILEPEETQEIEDKGEYVGREE